MKMERVSVSTTQMNGVTVYVNQMSHAEVKGLFKGRGRYLDKGDDAIVPLRVIVENNSNQAIVVKPAMMAITDPDIIYRKIERNVAGIAIASTVGGALLAGDLGGLAFGSGFGISNAKKNDKMLGHITHEAFVAPREVYPGDVFNKIMFVYRSELQPMFSLPVDGHMHRVCLA